MQKHLSSNKLIRITDRIAQAGRDKRICTFPSPARRRSNSDQAIYLHWPHAPGRLFQHDPYLVWGAKNRRSRTYRRSPPLAHSVRTPPRHPSRLTFPVTFSSPCPSLQTILSFCAELEKLFAGEAEAPVAGVGRIHGWFGFFLLGFLMRLCNFGLDLFFRHAPHLDHLH